MIKVIPTVKKKFTKFHKQQILHFRLKDEKPESHGILHQGVQFQNPTRKIYKSLQKEEGKNEVWILFCVTPLTCSLDKFLLFL